MECRTLGRTGIEVGVISLGAEHLSHADDRTNRAVVQAALDGGIRLIDLIFESRAGAEKMGMAIRGLRDRVLLTGHLGATFPSGDYLRTRDVETAGRWFEEMLRILGTDHVDVLMLHWVDEEDDFDRVFDANGFLGLALRLLQSGKARCLGVGTHRVPIALKAISTGVVDVLLFPINAAHDMLPGRVTLDDMWSVHSYERVASGEWSPKEDRLQLYQTCQKEGIGLLAMKPYAGGLLLHEGMVHDQLKGKGLEHPTGLALTPVQCLSYVLSRPGVCSAVVGCQTVSHVQDALHYLDAPEQERDFSVIHGSDLWRLQQRCTYCNHCLPCPVGIRVGDLLREADLADATDQPPRNFREAVAALGPTASDCTECGQCEQRCPFQVPVIERLRDIASRLE